MGKASQLLIVNGPQSSVGVPGVRIPPLQESWGCRGHREDEEEGEDSRQKGMEDKQDIKGQSNEIYQMSSRCFMTKWAVDKLDIF